MKKEKEKKYLAALNLLKEKGQLTTADPELRKAYGENSNRVALVLDYLKKSGHTERKEQKRKYGMTKYVYFYKENAYKTVGRKEILEKVKELKVVTVEKIASELGVKENTARFYLGRLSCEGEIFKTHETIKKNGMVLKKSFFCSEEPVDEKVLNARAKEKNLLKLLDECVRNAYHRSRAVCKTGACA